MSLKSACCTLQTLMMSAQRESGGADREMEKKPSITGDDDLILPGFRFHPTDEELVGFYLRRKVEKKPTATELIKQIDIYKYDPWDLPKGCRAGEKEWYFFCQRERKYRNSIRPNRVTGSGFWKATGIDKSINSPGEKTNCCIGLKKSLVYYRGSAGKCAKTDWMMHEFRLPFTTKNTSTLHTPNNIQEAEIWTICRIFRRRVSDTKHMRPNWKEESMKQNTGSRDSTSQRSIYEFSDAEKERLNYFFGASTTKPVSDECEEKKHLFPGRSSLPNSNAGKSYKYENWDELGAVVDFAIDPNL